MNNIFDEMVSDLEKIRDSADIPKTGEPLEAWVRIWERVYELRNLSQGAKFIPVNHHTPKSDLQVATERYGEKVAKELIAQMQKRFKKLDYVDNERFAKRGRFFEVFEYVMMKEHGCCGFVDDIIKIGGEEYAVGCNYGH